MIATLQVPAHCEVAESLPVLPAQAVETKLSSTPITGRQIVVKATSDMYQNGQALQRAIDEASLGDAVLVPPALYVGGSIELRKKVGTGWLTIKAATADTHLPPEGTRISPANKQFMPTIISPGFNVPPVKTEPGANHYRLIGLEITKLDPSAYVQEMVVIDAYDNRPPSTVTNLEDFPSNIIIDRCYIHGLRSNDMKRGIRLYCRSCAVIDSYIADAHVVGQEAQAILFGGGPLKLSNNYLEGAGENLFAQDYMSLRTARFMMAPTSTLATISSVDDLNVGDGIAIWDGKTNMYTHVNAIAGNQIQFERLSTLPSSTALVYWGKLPTDIEISYNYLVKPLSLNPNDPSYAGYHPNVKNLFELKSGRRVWVHHNVLENVWLDGQDGTAVLFTVRNQTGDCYFCAVEDITFEGNIVQNARNGIMVLATDYNAISGPTQNILIKNNLFLNILGSFQQNTIDAENIDHNTIHNGGYAMSVEQGARRYQNRFTNNVLMSEWASGFHYNDGTPPDWHAVFPDLFFVSNVFSRLNGFSAFFYMRDYADQNYEVDSPEDVGFVDWSNEDLALSATSWARNVATDGGPIGADVAMLASLRSKIRSGFVTQTSSTPPTSLPVRVSPGPATTAILGPPQLTSVRTGPTIPSTRPSPSNGGGTAKAATGPPKTDSVISSTAAILQVPALEDTPTRGAAKTINTDAADVFGPPMPMQSAFTGVSANNAMRVIAPALGSDTSQSYSSTNKSVGLQMPRLICMNCGTGNANGLTTSFSSFRMSSIDFENDIFSDGQYEPTTERK